MLLLRETTKAVRSALVLWILTALVYPMVLLAIGLAVPGPANGSLIQDAQGKVLGSALIGQPFSAEKYFWSRPSAIAYSTDAKTASTGVSGASNLAPVNPDLLKRINEEAKRLQTAGQTPTVDLLYASGSGLDPHITPEAATAQLDRIAKVRNLPRDRVAQLIGNNTDGRFLGLFGEPGTNVLKLNLALDRLSSTPGSQP